MFKNWYKYQQYHLSSNSKKVDYYYIYFCIPYFLRNGLKDGAPIIEHTIRLSFSLLKVSVYWLPKIMHVSLPFGLWYSQGKFHYTPLVK